MFTEFVADHEKWLETDGNEGKQLTFGYAVVPDTTLEGKLRLAKFTKTTFKNVAFKGDFAGAEFIGCTFDNCRFGTDTFLTDAQFAMCLIEDTDFGNALNRTKFIACQILTPDVS